MAATRERIGRPTQFHGVPLEERAFDSQGNRLPWALEYPDDHPNARLQKRQPEEKGSFGKSTRRKGSSRATRTQTPAKKENPTLDGFEAALRFDAQKEPQIQQVVGQSSTDGTHLAAPLIVKEPMQVMLYGYSPEIQWAALDFYESVSGGMICEDYEREPPAERRKYQSGLGYSGYIHPRALTKAERALAMQYRGGSCWIKVTFDSIEAGDRAVYNSPHLIHGYWVYAQPYRGEAYEPDEPILMEEQDRQQGLLSGPKPSRGQSQTLGASFATSMLQRNAAPPRSTATLPRSFTVQSAPGASRQPEDNISISSSTASSATALSPETPQTRQRNPSQTDGQLSAAGPRTPGGTVSRTPATFTHFPNTPRTVLRPATEAFLPQPSWTEKVFKQLTQSGWIPGDVIGVAVPRLESGEFDWSSASFYWKICYWLDTHFGMDLCGMKEA
ncbi:hypothetical protein MMC13_004725 [Lambiella insularis]|nr:hypothetical protein [Lambiella insularis]